MSNTITRVITQDDYYLDVTVIDDEKTISLSNSDLEVVIVNYEDIDALIEALEKVKRG